MIPNSFQLDDSFRHQFHERQVTLRTFKETLTVLLANDCGWLHVQWISFFFSLLLSTKEGGSEVEIYSFKFPRTYPYVISYLWQNLETQLRDILNTRALT